FFSLAPGSITWKLEQAYSAGASFTWNTGGLVGGTYRFSVWARAAAGTGTFGNVLGRWDGYTTVTYGLTFEPCASVSGSAAPSPAAVGVSVSVTALATGCANPRYQFFMLPPNSQSWLLAQPYSASATFTWDT